MNEFIKETIVIDELGFKKEELEVIENFFFCNLDLDDWESIKFIDYDEEDENHFKLPTGRMVYFPDELLRKDLLAQID